MPNSAPLFQVTPKQITPKPAAPVNSAPIPISITALTKQIQTHIESQFDSVWVTGQISNLTAHRSGHVYLTLKDEGAQLPCVLWKTSAAKIKFQLKDGMEIVCRGRLSVFPPHGKYQMVITELQPKGIGTLELAFQQLRDRLTAEGLFLPERKKPIPSTLRRIALLTSPTGAAVKDFLQILSRRTRLIDVLLVPVKVQGDGAAEEIAQSLRLVNCMQDIDRPIDCIVLTRGGGSKEDLWAFNEEVLVRAVAASAIPTVSAVGHEIDVSLCDFAADIRAATPSEAAERISKEDTSRKRDLDLCKRQLNDYIDRQLRYAGEQLRSLTQRSIFRRPEQLIDNRQFQLGVLEERIDRSMDHRLQSLYDHLGKTSAALEALSPLSILSRGYTLTENINGSAIRSAKEIQTGDVLRTRFADGVIESRCR